MTDEDLASIVVYLRSLPPVRNPLPPSNVPFPLNRLINGVPAPVDGAGHGGSLHAGEARRSTSSSSPSAASATRRSDDQGNRPCRAWTFGGGTALTYTGRKAISPPT